MTWPAARALESNLRQYMNIRGERTVPTASGNTADALRVYERCRTLIAEELGVPPSPETRALHAQVLQSLQPGATGTGSGTPGRARREA
jgi:hypothetical protein